MPRLRLPEHTRVRGAGVEVAVAVGLCLLLESLLIPPARAAPAGRNAIGDSVMLGAASNLRDLGFKVDAAVSRQWSAGVSLVRSMRNKGILRRNVLVHLGHNGPITQSQCRDLVRAIGKERHLWLVTLKLPRWWRAPNNRILRTCDEKHAKASLLEWYGHSHTHPGWFTDGGIHLRPLGRRRYAEYVDRFV